MGGRDALQLESGDFRLRAVVQSDGVIEGDAQWNQRELDRMAALLSERVAGRSLIEVRTVLLREAISNPKVY